MIKYISFILFFSICNLCCNPQESNFCIEKSIQDLFLRFPQLNDDKLGINKLKHIRTVRTPSDVELQLWSFSELIKDSPSVLVLKNSKKQCYSLPLLSNKYRDYWNFDSEESIEKVEKINTTFEKEFFKAVSFLNFNDSVFTCKIILAEFLQSLIHATEVSIVSKESFIEGDVTHNDTIPEETTESCSARYLKNYQTIQKHMNYSDSYHMLNAFWDQKNNRVYQIIDRNVFRYKTCDFSIKIYRQDCNIHLNLL
jgi:hypothetical protein